MSLTGPWRALGLAAAFVCVVVTAAPAAAKEPAAVGWWWVGRPSASLPALLAPTPAVPDGGLYVAGDSTGPTGISALRFEFDPEASATTLKLTIAEVSGTPSIDACPAADTWKPAENGGWDTRPQPDCDAASISGVISKDKTAVSFALTKLPDSHGTIDLVLVPGVDSETGSPASFAAAFDPPGADSLALTAAVKESADSPSPFFPNSSIPFSSFVVPATPPAKIEPAPKAELPAAVVASNNRRTRIATQLPVDGGFAYPVILALPLILLAGATYLSWTLMCPVEVRARRSW